MPLSVGVNRRYTALAGTVIVLLWCWVALGRPSLFSKDVSVYNHSNPPSSTSIAIAEDVFDYEPADSEAIQSVCRNTAWNETLVFTCENSVGGIGNIRNSILNCIRYAISAGGGLVMPKIILRDGSDISYIRTGRRIRMQHMFDHVHFIRSVELSCPGLRLYPEIESIPGQTVGPISLLPESLVPGNIPRTGLTHPAEWEALFYNWLAKVERLQEETVIVELGRSYLQYPIYSDGEDFALTFGTLLKLRSDTRILASSVLRRLTEKYSLPLNLSQPILRHAFFGAHLRTEKDAVEGWPAPDWEYSRFETQSRLYLEQAIAANTSLIYVASGDLTEVLKFAENARPLNITIITKADLLDGEEKEGLENLLWDQQALVDFMVMLKASNFAGVGHSSFAWNVALKRHIYAETKGHLDGPQLLSDELSQIYGLPRSYPEYAACLWP